MELLSDEVLLVLPHVFELLLDRVIFLFAAKVREITCKTDGILDAASTKNCAMRYKNSIYKIEKSLPSLSATANTLEALQDPSRRLADFSMFKPAAEPLRK